MSEFDEMLTICIVAMVAAVDEVDRLFAELANGRLIELSGGPHEMPLAASLSSGLTPIESKRHPQSYGLKSRS